MRLNNNVLKLNGSELISLIELFDTVDNKVIIASLNESFKKYPYILDSKSQISILFIDRYNYMLAYKKKNGSKYDRRTN